MPYLSYEPVELSFGTSGLRGLVTDMTDLECYINTRGFIDFLSSIGHLSKGTIYIAGDLRASTPTISRAVAKAITDTDLRVVNCGFIPTPALAYYAGQNASPSIMITGSHIPDDRNGIKFYKADGEVLKSDEAAIQACVAAVREGLDDTAIADMFQPNGSLRENAALPDAISEPAEIYAKRYADVFGSFLGGKTVVVYQHSAVGRDMLVELLQSLGATVVSEGRSEKFIPIDTENVTPEDQAYFRQLAVKYPDAYAIVSTDGDSDRPFVVDERGTFYRGDILGAVVADSLQADFAAYPVSSSDVVDTFLTHKNVPYVHTKIGSPYVIVAMQNAASKGKQTVVGWEVNGGFLLGTGVTIDGRPLDALPTRDAFFPILCALRVAALAHEPVSAAFARLPQRFTSAGMLDNFATADYARIKDHFSEDTEESRQTLQTVFTADDAFGDVEKIDVMDGVRIYFVGGDIAHVRGSGNAPQLRIYSVANSQERADAIVAMAIKEPDGLLRKLAEGTAG